MYTVDIVAKRLLCRPLQLCRTAIISAEYGIRYNMSYYTHVTKNVYDGYACR